MASAILGLLAETSLHAGASSSTGVIDLPIQREAHTGWPCVFGSGTKGALRTAADDQRNEELDVEQALHRAASGAPWVNEVFGPPLSNLASGDGSYAGALSVGDARLLLLPVRSLTGHFKWVACPANLRRAVADCQRLGFAVSPTLQAELEKLAPDEEAIIHKASAGTATPQNAAGQGASKLFLEELSFTKTGRNLTLLISFLSQFMNIPQASDLLGNQLVVVSDDIFAHLAQFATPVTPHIAIDNAHKRVKDGALWYEETLPPKTVLYVALQAQPSRQQESRKTAREVLRHIEVDLFGAKPYLQLGGNETVGMGWCKVAFVAPTQPDDAVQQEDG